jgi:hypothetical protein
VEALRRTSARVQPMKVRPAESGWSPPVATSLLVGENENESDGENESDSEIAGLRLRREEAFRPGVLSLRAEALPDLGQFLVTPLADGLLWSFPRHDEEANALRYEIPAALGPAFLVALPHRFALPLGSLALEAAQTWESVHGAYNLRTFGSGPTGYRSALGRPVSDADWGGPGHRRALVFVHGFIDRGHLAFRHIPDALMEELEGRYGGRVFAFDHPSMSKSPFDNASWLIDQIPAGVRVEVDLVCHSRGGLVARALNEKLPPGGPIAVKKIVFAGTPNAGTPIAAADRIGDLFSALSTMMLRRPNEGPVGGLIADAMGPLQEGLGYFAQLFLTSVLAELPGLRSMDPAQITTEMNVDIDRRGAEYFAIGAAYQPHAGGIAGAAAGLGAEFYRVPNDLVVPTYSVAYPDNWPVPPRLFDLAGEVFFTGQPIYHDNLFEQPDTLALLNEHLKGH